MFIYYPAYLDAPRWIFKAMSMRIETSELEGKSFSCLDGCAMCCLCQPELSDNELGTFMGNPDMAKGLTDRHINGGVTEKLNAILLKGGCGACFFLRNRRCTIYDFRPRFCRQFPIHLHALDRIQMNANLSCRGVVADGGDSLMAFSKTLEGDIPSEAVAGDSESSIERFQAFRRRCIDAGIYQSPERLSSLGKGAVSIVSQNSGVAKMLAYASDEPVIGDMSPEELISGIEDAVIPGDLSGMAGEANYEQFNLDNPAWLPIYVDERLQWNVFRARRGAIEWMELSEDGSLRILNKIDLKEIRLLPLEMSGNDVLSDYARTLVGRDHFRGFVYYVCAEQGYRHDLATVYIGVLGTTLLDLWWRISLVGKTHNRKSIERWLAMEGVRAFDMDCLDAPTIGGFF